MSQLRQLEIESEHSKQEVIVHRAAFLQLESESTHRLAVLQTGLDEATRRLRSYEVNCAGEIR